MWIEAIVSASIEATSLVHHHSHELFVLLVVIVLLIVFVHVGSHLHVPAGGLVEGGVGAYYDGGWGCLDCLLLLFFFFHYIPQY